MKTLADERDLAEVARRIGLVSPTSRRRWGKMTAAQMICHLSDAYRVALGERHAEPVKNRYNGAPMKWAGLWLPFPWPHGVATVPECDAMLGGTPPADLEEDKRDLLVLVNRFVVEREVIAGRAHPFFGILNAKEWMRWGYLHADHHLRQFSA
ncbi:MAG TPA: hypothetical protein VMT38_03105 [Terracidiphilus sp.]|nr:hypothetical protein [Terracidiphilus sp.]